MVKKIAREALKTTSKTVIQKAAAATGDLLVIRLLIEVQKSQKLPKRLNQKRLQVNMVKKYLKKDIYLQTKFKNK